MICDSVNLLFFIKISSFLIPRKFYFQTPFIFGGITLKGVSYGEFDLRIAHTTSVTSETYLQNNAMTRLSWGPMRPYVARADLIDRNLALYRDEVDPTRFVLEID